MWFWPFNLPLYQKDGEPRTRKRYNGVGHFHGVAEFNIALLYRAEREGHGLGNCYGHDLLTEKTKDAMNNNKRPKLARSARCGITCALVAVIVKFSIGKLNTRSGSFFLFFPPEQGSRVGCCRPSLHPQYLLVSPITRPGPSYTL